MGESRKLYYTALIGYIFYEASREEKGATQTGETQNAEKSGIPLSEYKKLVKKEAYDVTPKS